MEIKFAFRIRVQHTLAPLSLQSVACFMHHDTSEDLNLNLNLICIGGVSESELRKSFGSSALLIYFAWKLPAWRNNNKVMMKRLDAS